MKALTARDGAGCPNPPPFSPGLGLGRHGSGAFPRGWSTVYRHCCGACLTRGLTVHCCYTVVRGFPSLVHVPLSPDDQRRPLAAVLAYLLAESLSPSLSISGTCPLTLRVSIRTYPCLIRPFLRYSCPDLSHGHSLANSAPFLIQEALCAPQPCPGCPRNPHGSQPGPYLSGPVFNRLLLST